jgi:hypothetical protein
VYDTKIATRIESRTSQELYVPTMKGLHLRADLGRIAITISFTGAASKVSNVESVMEGRTVAAECDARLCWWTLGPLVLDS